MLLLKVQDMPATHIEKNFRQTLSIKNPSATAFIQDEIFRIINLYSEHNPEGLQKKFFHIAAHELAWWGGEATNCLVTYFREEFDNKGTFTGRIIYNPIISKTAQGGSKKLTKSKWLTVNKTNQSMCPVR